MLTQTTHVSLLRRLSRGHGGDAHAWSDFCDRYGELIRGYARRCGLQPADCDDVVQDVLVSLTKAMPGFEYDPSKGRFRAYLQTMVMHAVQKRWFQKRGERPLGEEAADHVSDGSDADRHWESEWRQHHLRLAQSTIAVEFNAGDRAAFQLYAIDGRDAKEAAAELSMSVEQVYQAKSRILRRLGELIQQQIEEEG